MAATMDGAIQSMTTQHATATQKTIPLMPRGFHFRALDFRQVKLSAKLTYFYESVCKFRKEAIANRDREDRNPANHAKG